MCVHNVNIMNNKLVNVPDIDDTTLTPVLAPSWCCINCCCCIDCCWC